MKLSDIKPNPNNPRLIKDDRFKNLVKSIEEFPKMMKLRPIIVDNNMIILGGNMRYKALQELKFKDIPDEWVKKASELNEEEIRRFIIADNIQHGDWDYDLLADWDSQEMLDWGLEIPEINNAIPWNPEEKFDGSDNDGIELKAGYRLSSIWYGMERNTEITKYMLDLPANVNAKDGATVKLNYSRTNGEETERIIKTYMRNSDIFYEMCCGWMTFSSTAKYLGYSGKGSDIWDKSIEYCKKQIEAMPGTGNVEIECADCRNTKEPDGYYDFIHSNPPFFSLESYSDNDNDLAATGSYDLWLNAMSDMGKEAERIIKLGGLANFVINDFRKDSILKPMHSDFINAIQKKSNLKLHDIVIAEVVSQALRFRKHDYERKRTVKCHEYVITFKK